MCCVFITFQRLIPFQINDVKMYRALSIRSAMAGSLQTETPMFWLNDCIEIIIRLKFVICCNGI